MRVGGVFASFLSSPGARDFKHTTHTADRTTRKRGMHRCALLHVRRVSTEPERRATRWQPCRPSARNLPARREVLAVSAPIQLRAFRALAALQLLRPATSSLGQLLTHMSREGRSRYWATAQQDLQCCYSGGQNRTIDVRGPPPSLWSPRLSERPCALYFSNGGEQLSGLSSHIELKSG